MARRGKRGIRTLESQMGKGGTGVPKGGIEREAKHERASEFGSQGEAGARPSARSEAD